MGEALREIGQERAEGRLRVVAPEGERVGERRNRSSPRGQHQRVIPAYLAARAHDLMASRADFREPVGPNVASVS